MSWPTQPQGLVRWVIRISAVLGLFFGAVVGVMIIVPHEEVPTEFLAIMSLLTCSSSVGLLRRWRWAYRTFIACLGYFLIGWVAVLGEIVSLSSDIPLLFGVTGLLAVWVRLLLLASVREEFGFDPQVRVSRLIGWIAVATGALNLLSILDPGSTEFLGFVLGATQASVMS